MAEADAVIRYAAAGRLWYPRTPTGVALPLVGCGGPLKRKHAATKLPSFEFISAVCLRSVFRAPFSIISIERPCSARIACDTRGVSARGDE